MSLKIREAPATELLTTLYEAYMGKKLLFAHVHADTHAPQLIYTPKGQQLGSTDDLIWRFHAARTDRRSLSSKVYQTHQALKEGRWQTAGDLFREANDSAANSMLGDTRKMYRKSVLRMTEGHIAYILSSAGIFEPNLSAQQWMQCARVLWAEYDGDPVNIFREHKSVDAFQRHRVIYERAHGVNPFPGFGPKITSLFVIFCEQLGKLYVPDAFPIDVHVQRFFIQHGLLESTMTRLENVELEALLRPFLSDLCNQKGWSRVDLAHAIWFLGSSFCTKCYQRKDAPVLCPVYASCTGVIDSRSYFKERMWYLDSERFPKGGTTPFGVPMDSLFEQAGA